MNIVLRAQTNVATIPGTQQLVNINGTPTVSFNANSANGAIYTIATNTTLAAATYSAVVSIGYSKTSTLFFLATCTTAGTVTIALSGEGTYYANHLVTITMPIGTTGIVLSLPPLRYVKLISTVALTAFTANVTTSY
jgi:hypothetical protein